MDDSATPAPPRVVHIDSIEEVPGPGSLTWRPVRLTLGIEAFGTNAYTAHAAGDDVVEPHTESPKLKHQELYFVARGRATFTIDGKEYDAPAGTYVFVPDHRSHRHAVAAEPETTVLSFGGPATFVPSAWEWSFRASAVREADPAAARAVFEEGLAASPGSADVRYNFACLEAQLGDDDRALELLGQALAIEPALALHAAGDEDLAALRARPEFTALLDSAGP